MNELIPYQTINFDLMPKNPSKDVKSRIGKFTRWMDENEHSLLDPNLSAYRDYLLDDYTPASASAHLSTVRAQYSRILRDNHTRDMLFEIASEQTENPLERKAFVDEVTTRLNNAIDPKNSEVNQTKTQDNEDTSHLRLTKEQAETLLQAPGLKTLKGIRDTAIIALMLCTGIREAELCGLKVDDLRQTFGGALALRIREGKGKKKRMIPYGRLEWALVVVDAWLQAADIKDGFVFRGMFKGDKLRPGKMTTRALQYMLKEYPIAINGGIRTVAPHDLRRTYAKRLYVAGTDLLAIQQNLGHKDHKTTEGYIGELDSSRRQPPAVYSFNLAKVKKIGKK